MGLLRRLVAWFGLPPYQPSVPPTVDRIVRSLTDQVEEMEAFRRGGEPWYAFRSTIEPDRWYVGRGKVAILATEIGASGEREARLVADLYNTLPALLLRLALDQAALSKLRRQAPSSNTGGSTSSARGR